jgi:hypothetical protein
VQAGFGHQLLVASGVLTISPMKQISPVVAAMAPHFCNFDVSIPISD